MFLVDEEQLCQISELAVVSKEEGEAASTQKETETRRKVSIRVEEPSGSSLDIPPNTLSGSSSSETLMGELNSIPTMLPTPLNKQLYLLTCNS